MAGSTFSAFAKQLEGTFSPFSLVLVSELLMVSFVFFSFGLLPTFRRMAMLGKKEWGAMILLGLFSGVAGPSMLFFGLKCTSAINASLFSRVDIIFNLTFAHLLFRERLGKEHMLAICCAAVGILIVTLHGFTQGLHLAPGDLLIIGSTIAYASGSIVYRCSISHVEPQVAMLFRSMAAIVLFGIISIFLPSNFLTELASMPLSLLPVLLGFAFVSRFLNSMFYYNALNWVPYTTVTMVGTLDIVFSGTFAFLYLGEGLEAYQLIGAFFLVLGNIILACYHTQRTHQHVVAHLQQKH